MSIMPFASQEVEPLTPGKSVGGKYRILKPLGQGGMGALYLVSALADPSLRYALKILPSRCEHEMEQRFLREAELLFNLNHPCIVRFYDMWRDERGISLVMEYVPGRDLARIKAEGVEIDEFNTLLIGQCVADALNYAWDELRLLHRDIKPDNIMITDEGKVKLLDFGIAKSLDSISMEQDPGLTVIGNGLGSPGYMSPEQFLDGKSVSCTSDIFSLGATMYFILTGRLPFPGKNAMEFYESIMNRGAVPLRSLNPNVSEHTEKLIHAMLQRDPAKRPFSWRRLLAEINRVEKGMDPIL